MRIAIVGSRNFSDIDAVRRYVLDLPKDTEIVSGGAQGVDSAAVSMGIQRNLKCSVCLPDWDTYGKSAGIIRNQQIVDAADMVVAFWDGESKGTLNTIERALKARHIQRVTVYKGGAT